MVATGGASADAGAGSRVHAGCMYITLCQKLFDLVIKGHSDWEKEAVNKFGIPKSALVC